MCDENVLTDLLPVYYSRLFPLDRFCKWLSYAGGKSISFFCIIHGKLPVTSTVPELHSLTLISVVKFSLSLHCHCIHFFL